MKIPLLSTELCITKMKLQESNTALLRAKGKLNIRGALFFVHSIRCDFAIYTRSSMKPQEPEDPLFKKPIDSSDFAQSLKKVCNKMIYNLKILNAVLWDYIMLLQKSFKKNLENLKSAQPLGVSKSARMQLSFAQPCGV